MLGWRLWSRNVLPRVSLERDFVQMKHDLDMRRIRRDKPGVNRALPPEIAIAFKQAFDFGAPA